MKIVALLFPNRIIFHLFTVTLLLWQTSPSVYSFDLSKVQVSAEENNWDEEEVYEKLYKGSFELRENANNLASKNKTASEKLFQEALINYQKAIILLGPREEFLFQMGQTYLGMGSEQEALKVFKEAKKVGGRDKEIQGILDRRIETLAKKFPDKAAPPAKLTEKEAYDRYYYPSFELRGQKKFQEAIENYKMMIDLKMGDTNIYKQMALTYSSQGNLKLAISTLEEALKKWPDDKYNRYLFLFLAEFYKQLGDQDKQIETFERANAFSLRVFKRPHVTALKQLWPLQKKEFICPMPQEMVSDPLPLLNSFLDDLSQAVGDHGRAALIAQRLKSSFGSGQFNTDAVMTRTPEIITDELYDQLKDIHEVFTEAGLKYVMAAGTLLGAVRHQGIIPWDDDGDLAIREKDITPEKLKKIRTLLQARDLEIIEDESCGYKIRRIGEYAPAIDIFTLREEEAGTQGTASGEKFLVYAKEKAFKLFSKEKYPPQTFEAPPVLMSFGDFKMNGLSPEEGRAYLDRAYGVDWNYLAYKEWDHIHDRPVAKEKVLLVDRKAPLTKVSRAASAKDPIPPAPPLNVTYIDSFQEGDLARLKEKEKDELRTLLRGCFPGTVINSIQKIYEMNLAKNKVSILRNETGSIIGTIIGFYEKDESKKDYVFIDKVCVDPNQRGKGMGSRFLSDFMEKADTLKTKTYKLTVMKENGRAKSLYERPPFLFKVSKEYGSAYEMTRKVDGSF